MTPEYMEYVSYSIHMSLESGTFADNWICAIVNPLLKKSDLDLDLSVTSSMYRNLKELSLIKFMTTR